MDASWQAWVTTNIDRGCDPEDIVRILLEHKFTIGEIRDSMGDQFPRHSELVRKLPPEIDYKAIADLPITRSNDPNLTRIDSPKLQLFVLENFMTARECADLIALIGPTLRPSEISFGPADFRTSQTSDLSFLKHPLVEALDERIARTLGIRLPYSDGIQAQSYKVGQQFKPHTDFFEPGHEEYQRFASAMGNRTWTFMVYLDVTPKGGGTHFVEIDKIFCPRPGRALFWNNLDEYGRPNPNTMHAGLPVEEGEKNIITKWFREKGQGPMFY